MRFGLTFGRSVPPHHHPEVLNLCEIGHRIGKRRSYYLLVRCTG